MGGRGDMLDERELANGWDSTVPASHAITGSLSGTHRHTAAPGAATNRQRPQARRSRRGERHLLHVLSHARAYLQERSSAVFVSTLSEKLARYARGRRLSDAERQALAAIPSAVAPHQFQFSRLILEVVQSAPFQTGRRGDAGVAAN
jgi:hypothetical protein